MCHTARMIKADTCIQKLDDAVKKARANKGWRALNVQWTFAWRRPRQSGDRVYDADDERSGKSGDWD